MYVNNPGHMTKMGAMPINGKNPLKIFFSGTNFNTTLHVTSGTRVVQCIYEL